MPTHAVRSITAEVSADGHQLAQDGPHVAFIDGSGVELVDLRDASKILVAKTSDGDVPWWIDLSGDNLVWLAGGFDGGNDSHCDGAMSWRINVFNLANASTKKLASGISKRVPGCSAWPPPVAVAGDLVAYAIENPSPDVPEASTVVIRSITTDNVVRTIESTHVVDNVDLDAGDVAFVEGSYKSDSVGDYWYDLDDRQLMLSKANNPTPVVVARDPDDVSFSHGRLAWFQTQVGSPDLCLTATVNDMTPVQVGGRPAPFWGDVATSGTFIAFVSNDLVWLWDEQSLVTRAFQVPAYPYGLSTSGGWLVWYGYALNDGDPNTLQGLPIEDLPVLGS